MKKFKQFIAESINDTGIFKAVFVIGIPGSGKSYTSKSLAGRISPRIVNTDKATEFLAARDNVTIDSKIWMKTYKDTALRVTKSALTQYLNGVLPLMIDGTSNDASNLLHRMGILESLGYDVGIIYVNTSLDTAIKRVEERNATTNRTVDLDFVRAVHERTEANVEFLRSKVSFFAEVKNDIDEYNDQVMKKAFSKTQSFFNSEISNPIGRRLLEKMKAEKQPYLAPEIIPLEVLSKKVEGWYR